MINSNLAASSRFSQTSAPHYRGNKENRERTCRLISLLVPTELVISFSNDGLVRSTGPGSGSFGLNLCGDGGRSPSLNTNRSFDTNTVDVLRARPVFFVGDDGDTGDDGCASALGSSLRNASSQLLLVLLFSFARPSTILILLLNRRSRMLA
jgi:hypothetical protein